MHDYQRKSFTLEQERRLRSSASPSGYISNFLTEKEFKFCRKLVMGPINYPECGKVAKYWGFGWDTPMGQLLKWIKPKINEIIDDWELDFFAIQEAITPWKLHADIRWYADKIPYKVILIPMDVEPTAGAVDPFEWPDTYTAVFNQRNFLSRWPETANTANLKGNDQSNWIRPKDGIQYEGLIPGYHLTKDQWQEYFSHLPYSDLEGLTLDKIHRWTPGSLFYWDNTSVHCADNFLGKNIKTKRSLMLFTVLK
jgi:hypothetical protein